MFLEHDHALCEITCMTFYSSWCNPRVHSREVKGYNVIVHTPFNEHAAYILRIVMVIHAWYSVHC